ncbi:hypothetical protein N7931_03745 [Catenovulum sp. 2E275]|uniref:hypothetical protein n=1 Tax=Catenovulum sp. 2E275 TaxID=2980497 RepID=UPI0021D0DF23|nr:hypothetical protein [Catenovulum sp. 2E275]MCU4674740.1 hypothetical protein [Catenovulum sp. 2E275]
MKLLIIGAGGLAARYIDNLTKHGIAQNSRIVSTLTGQHFNGLPINQLSQDDLNWADKVVICSQYVNDIYKNLINFSFCIDQIFVFDYKTFVELPISDVASHPRKPTRKNLLAVYDLNQYHLSFNFAYFVNKAQAYAEHFGYDAITFVVVEGNFSRVSLNDSRKYSAQQYAWRFENMLHPLATMVPLFSKILFVSEKEKNGLAAEYDDRDIFPQNAVKQGFLSKDYCSITLKGLNEIKNHLPNVQTLEINPQAFDYLKGIFPAFDSAKAVCLTIRASSYVQGKNSQIDEWSKLSAYLLCKGYQVYIVPDISQTMSQAFVELFKGTQICYPAALNLHLRCALQAASLVNLTAASGAAVTLMLNKKSRFISFFNETLVYDAKQLFNQTGLYKGETPTFFSKFQVFNWGADNFDNMRSAFEQYEQQFLEVNLK